MPELWFCLVAISIAGYVVLDGFDLGAGFVSLFIAKDDGERRQVLSAIGPFWDGNEVWLLAGGGTLYFAFPALYASAFSGFYLALMIVLWLLILRGIAIEFRSHVDSGLWRSFWDVVFGASSAVLALLLGVALGNVVRGVPLDANGYFFLPLWTDFLPGSDAGIIDWYTVLIGLASLSALVVHGCLWIAYKTSGRLQDSSRKAAGLGWWILAALTLLVSIVSFSVQPHLWEQFQTNAWGGIFPILALLGLGIVKWQMRRGTDDVAFLGSCLYLVGMLTSVTFGVFPYVLPSNVKPDFSLTVHNAAAAQNGLEIGLWWWIPGMLLALAYSVFVYRRFAGKVEPS
jgi:cytochrome d ubiquinol oxidase subunit II